MRIGGAETLPVDVRVIAATNQDLREMVKRGEFRLDLFYRLNVLPLHIPPLRERVEDVEVLLNYYLSKYAVLQNKPKPHISSVILEMLDKHPWRGNVRELENIADFIAVSYTHLMVGARAMAGDYLKVFGHVQGFRADLGVSGD